MNSSPSNLTKFPAGHEFTNYPVLVTRGSYVFPFFQSKMEVGRDFSLNAIKLSAQQFSKQIILLSQKDINKDKLTLDDIFQYGVIATFDIQEKISSSSVKTIIFRSHDRVQVTNLKFDKTKNLWTSNAKVEKSSWNRQDFLKLIKKQIPAIASVIQSSKDSFNKLWNEKSDIKELEDASRLVDLMIQEVSELPVKIKQKALEETNVVHRLKLFEIKSVNVINKGSSRSTSIDDAINSKIRDKVDDQKREYYLREKLRVIKEELEEFDGPTGNKDIATYRKRLETEPFPEVIKTRLLEEIDHLGELASGSSEANVIRSYIDLMMSLPWWETTTENDDLSKARKILDANHYGLLKIKERIIEYLALRALSKNSSGQIICFLGPPGVGKTSLARSIAKATNRNFASIALGGIKDESEIRGHRKTYIGAMPGRIIQCMKKAKSINPVILLDEIDKTSSDYRGDPVSALLSVLDRDENKFFSDHYVEEEYDLSNVMFITTANYYENIPEALLDRLDVIDLSSYTEIEKLKIAQKHLLPKILINSGLELRQIKFTIGSLRTMIKFYTREAGVRQLDRLIQTIVRKFIVKFLNKELTTLTVTNKVVHQFLGKHKYSHTEKDRKEQVGTVTGLAYTQYGGDILPIEVNYFPGKGNLILTGKLGEVMRESGLIALDYIKSNAEVFGIDFSILSKNDIHVHVPEGAVPKDGPSAGMTLTTAIVSAMKKYPISNDIGMTGEITLRGHILPIGGLKEKSISAHRSGLKQIFIPEKNKVDVVDIPKEIKSKLKIIFINDFKQIFRLLFHDHKPGKAKPVLRVPPDNIVTTKDIVRSSVTKKEKPGKNDRP